MALDLELVDGPTKDGLDIVSVADMQSHLRITVLTSALQAEIESAVRTAASLLHGPDGMLNRTVFPCTWRRYLPRFSSIIRLPYPELIRVVAIGYEDGTAPSPTLSIDSSNYFTRVVHKIPQIEFLSTFTKPTHIKHPRAVWVDYEAGYANGYPEQIKRFVKIMAAHYMQNPEATINEPRQMQINRIVEYGHDYLLNLLRVSNELTDWDEC